jgi:SAM-dependent methyltransferase
VTKHWFPDCDYSGVDIQRYNIDEHDDAAMDSFYLVGADGSGYDSIPNNTYDFVVLHHVIEHMRNPAPVLAGLCRKLKPGGYIWIAFPSLRSLSLPPATEGTLQFCDDDSHVYLPDIREVSNILLANEVTVLHAGKTRDVVRSLIGIAVLPLTLIRRVLTGKLSAMGLWYLLGFEDHVFGRRILREDAK